MDDSVREVEPDVWRVEIGGITRIIRYRGDTQTFAPWDVTSADGRKLWSASSLESAFRWIQARTGYPAEALFTQALLEYGSRRAIARAEVPDGAAHVRKSRFSTPG